MNQSTKAMIIASVMIDQGLNRAEAMKQAWNLVKVPQESRVAGVTFENRQKAIQHLTRYPPANIEISLARDKGNQYDSNAVAVVASVVNRGSYTIGFLPKNLAKMLAPVLDRGEDVESTLKEIAGGYSAEAKYGLVISFKL
jgi:hypothetical protein